MSNGSDEVITDRMRGVDCHLCEDGTNHIHGFPAKLPAYSELYERSKDDALAMMIVGSEVREVIADLREALAQIAALTTQVDELQEEVAGRKEQVGDLVDSVFDSDDELESLKAELAALREGAKIHFRPYGEHLKYGSAEGVRQDYPGRKVVEVITRERILDTTGGEG